MNNETNDTIKELIARYLAGEASREEADKLQAWIAADKANDQFYRDSKKIMEAADRHYDAAQIPDINIDEEWHRFEQNAKLDNARSFGVGYALKIAASILLIAVSSAIIYYYSTQAETQIYMAHDQTLRVELPDGSVVMLNRNSELVVDADFDEETRSVKLRGEAFFEVRRSPKKRFVIHAKNAQVEVLGTSFNVQAYDSIDHVEVVVETGLVKVSPLNKQIAIELKPGQRGVVAESDEIKEEINTDQNYQSWNTQKLIFNEAYLPDVIRTLNKAYHAHIELTGSVSDSCRVTVSFDHQTLDAVLRVLESTLNISVQRSGSNIEIISSGC